MDDGPDDRPLDQDEKRRAFRRQQAPARDAQVRGLIHQIAREKLEHPLLAVATPKEIYHCVFCDSFSQHGPGRCLLCRRPVLIYRLDTDRSMEHLHTHLDQDGVRLQGVQDRIFTVAKRRIDFTAFAREAAIRIAADAAAVNNSDNPDNAGNADSS